MTVPKTFANLGFALEGLGASQYQPRFVLLKALSSSTFA